MEQRAVGALAQYPSGNAQGTWYFWSLETGKMIHQKQWDKLPVSKEVIDRVNNLGLQNGQRAISRNFRYTTNLGFGDETESQMMMSRKKKHLKTMGRVLQQCSTR